MKRKSTPVKYNVGGLLSGAVSATPYGAAIQGALGLGQAAFGLYQRYQSKKELDKLAQNRPNVYVPPAIRKLAEQPVAEELMQQQADESRRRTSQTIGALQKGGSRALLGGLNRAMDAERANERQRMANYAQETQRAQQILGAEQRRVQDLNRQDWMLDVEAARNELGAGQQNVFGGAGQLGRGLTYLGGMYGGDLMKMGRGQQEEPVMEKGGKLNGEHGGKTKGDFSHDKNPIKLVNKEGEVEGEVTGNEYVLNPKQAKEIEKESKTAKNLFSLFRRKNKKRSK